MDTTVIAPETLTLNCTGRNPPDSPRPLDFIWSRGGGLLEAGTNLVLERIEVDNVTVTSQLIIPMVTPEDGGDYRCEVTNREFDDRDNGSAVATVTVLCKASLFPHPAGLLKW